ncbi:Gigasin-3a [Bulinus truncatus]|nr:Gigasin-3a [Bulinus truncatus]
MTYDTMTYNTMTYDTMTYNIMAYNTTTYNHMTYNTLTYNTLTYNTMTYDTMTYDTMTYDTMKYDTMRYNTMTYDTMTYNIMTYNTLAYNTITYNTMAYNTMIYNTMIYKTMTYNTMTYNTMTYNTMAYNTMTDNHITNNTMTYNNIIYNTMIYNTMAYNTMTYDICGDYIYITSDDERDRANGKLLVYSKYSEHVNKSMRLIHSINVGAIPDMLQISDDCTTVLVAVEGEPYNTQDGQVDPPGAVVILHFPESNPEKSLPTIKSLDFKKFHNSYEKMLSSGVRFSYKQDVKSFTDELEPEYIALDLDSKKAFVVLQENNAVAEIDLVNETIKEIHGLGYKQWGHLDASDEDEGISITYWPIRSFYQPDGIKFHKWQGHKLAFTANEGEPRSYPSAKFDERQKGKSFINSKFSQEVPSFLISALNDSSKLGKLVFSQYDGLDINGVYQSLYTFGGRSFSIWDTEDKFKLLYDSGSAIEEKTAEYCPHLFNSDGEVVDSRSDNQGPQPEGITTGQIGSRLYVFVSNERPGTIIVYSIDSDVTNPRFETIFCEGIPNDSRSLRAKFDARDLYMIDPEDIKFLGAGNNIGGEALLFVSGSHSSTVSVLKITVTDDESDQKFIFSGSKAVSSHIIQLPLLLVITHAFLC